MPYATLSDLIVAIGEPELILLTDRINDPPSAVDAAVVAKALDAANAMVDSYIMGSGRYELPLPSVPDMLRDTACDIALYKLHGVAMPEVIALKYRDALSYLRDVQAGRALLQGVAQGKPETAGLVYFTPGERVFTRGSRV